MYQKYEKVSQKHEKVCQKLGKYAKSWESMRKAQEQLFWAHLISQMLFVHMLDIAFGKTLLGLVLRKCASSSLVCILSAECCLSICWKLYSAKLVLAFWWESVCQALECTHYNPNALCPYVRCCIWQILIWLFDDNSGLNLGGGGVKAFPSTACCCQKDQLEERPYCNYIKVAYIKKEKAKYQKIK